MDLKLFWSIIRRHKRLTIGGPLLGAVLAILAYGQPALSHGKPTVIPRGEEVWQSQSQLLITQESFPYGRASEQYTSPSGKAQPVPLGDIGYMSSLAPIYAALANGNAFQADLRKAAPVAGTAQASEVDDPATNAPLPLVGFTAIAPTSAAAALLAERAATELQAYVSRQQTAAGVVGADRVVLDVVLTGSKTTLVTGHKPTIPMLVFAAFLIGSLAAAFMLENSRGTPADAAGLDLHHGERLVQAGRYRDLHHGERVVQTGTSEVANRLIHSLARPSAQDTSQQGPKEARREAS